jgi:hypothetical protein
MNERNEKMNERNEKINERMNDMVRNITTLPVISPKLSSFLTSKLETKVLQNYFSPILIKKYSTKTIINNPKEISHQLFSRN